MPPGGASIPRSYSAHREKPLKRPAFVLNTLAVGIATARSLASKGVPVIAMDYQAKFMKLRSNSFVAHHLMPSIMEDEGAAVEALIRRQEESGEKGVLFPASDAFVLFVSRHREKLAGHFDFALPGPDVVEGIIDKGRQYQAAKRIGIPIPETYFPRGPEDLDEIKAAACYPMMIKPYYSHLWQLRFPCKGFQVDGDEALERRFAQAAGAGLDVLVQRIVPGPHTNYRATSAYTDRDGRQRGALETQKLRQHPVDFGIGTLIQTKHCPEVRELGQRFMRGLGYRGICYVEFKQDETDGQFKLMELNCRVVKNTYLATAAGVNHPWMQYQDLAGMPLEEHGEYQDGVKWHDFIDDCRAYMTLRRSGEISFREWVSSSLRAESHPYFSWGDLGPVMAKTRYGTQSARELFYVSLFQMGQVLKRSRHRGV